MASLSGRIRATILLVLAVPAIALAWSHSYDDAAWTIAVPAWIASVAFVLAAARSVGPLHPAEGTAPWRRAEIALLIAICAGTIALRAWNLRDYPAQLHNDEMSCGLEARKFLAEQSPSLFAAGWAGHPNLGYWLLSLPLRVIADPITALRTNAVIYGTLSLLGTYLLLRLLFNWTLAASAACLIAGFHWHLHLSRTGFTYVQADAFIVCTMTAFAYARTRGSVFAYALAGILLGLSLQVYSSTYLIAIVLAGWTVAQLVSDRRRGRHMAAGLAVTVAAALVTYAPVAAFFVAHPADFGERARQVYVFEPRNQDYVAALVGSSNVWDILSYQTRQTLQFLSRGGDTGAQYGFNYALIDPFLFWPSVAGLVLALRRWRSAGVQLVLIWCVLTLGLGSVITIDPPFSPHLTPMVTLVPFFGAYALWSLVRVVPNVGRPFALAAAIVVGVLSTSWNLQHYFRDYAAAMPGIRRDRIVRLLNSYPQVRTVLNTTTEPEDFRYESYQYVCPELSSANTPGATHTIAPSLRPALLITPSPHASSVDPARCMPLDDKAVACWIE